MSVCEIIPGLWLGNIKAASSLEFFEQQKISCVINCSKDIPFFNDKCENVRIAVHDNLERDEIKRLYEYFDKATNFIHLRLQANKNILVHCYAGKQRSASIIAVYLMKYASLTLYNAIFVIKSKRECAFTPTINFQESLEKYSKNKIT